MVPPVNTDSTDIFVQIYRSFLKDGGTLNIDQIVVPYRNMKPALHPGAVEEKIDFPAFLYSSLRLPDIMNEVDFVILAQSDEVFNREGYRVEDWKSVSASARRRKMAYDGAGQLGVFINSVTDLDDVVCLITAYQIEWNKINKRLADLSEDVLDNKEKLRQYLDIESDMWEKFEKIWKKDSVGRWSKIAKRKCSVQIKSLRGSYVDYKKASQLWFSHIMDVSPEISDPNVGVYFVSSNTHSIVNNITGFVNNHKNNLIEFMKKNNMQEYLNYWNDISNGLYPGSEENFFWYILKKFESENKDVTRERIEFERKCGIRYVEAEHFLDVNAQVIELSAFSRRPDLGEKLGVDTSALKNSKSIIVNIDYPLGFGAYMVLSTVLRNAQNVRGVYVLGKASFLNGNLGDVAIPTTIFDEISKNTFIINNAFSKSYLSRFAAGNVLTNQKLISVRGTLLHPEEVIREYFKKGFAIVEMENGSYLNALYEFFDYSRYPENTTISMVNSPVDIGIINYASDTPFTKAVTLATRNLGYEGVEATYESSLAIIKRIAEVELSRINNL